MGRTTNRQPVTFAIPTSPNYKFLNITEFKGLNITDNPFIASADSASDCLNVYVDESNALTTRPRLEKIFNIEGIKKVLHTYALDSATIFQVLTKDDRVKLYQYTDTAITPIDTIRFDLKEDKYCVFEKDDVYYVTGNGIYASYTNHDLVLKKIEDAYVPVRYIGDVLTDKLVEDEDRNILTKKYRIAYSWDTKSNPSKIYENNGVLIDNEYHKTRESNRITYNTFSHPDGMFESSNGDVFKIGVTYSYHNELGTMRVVSKFIEKNYWRVVLRGGQIAFNDKDINSLIDVGNLSGWIVSVNSDTEIEVVLPMYYKAHDSSFALNGDVSDVSIYRDFYDLTELKTTNKIEEHQKIRFGGKVIGISPNGNVVAFGNHNRTGMVIINRVTKEKRYLFYDESINLADKVYSHNVINSCVISNDMSSVLVVLSPTTNIKTETGDWVYDWKLVSYSYNYDSVKYVSNDLYENKTHTLLYSSDIELKYDETNDKALIYAPGVSNELLYINSLASNPTEIVKKWNRLWNSDVLSFSKDLSVIYNIQNGVLRLGLITDAVDVSEVSCDLNGLVVTQQALSDSNLFMFATEQSVYGYDATNNTYYKMYDLTNIPVDDYYNHNTITSHLLSKNNVLYRTTTQWNGPEHSVPSMDNYSLIAWVSDSLEFSPNDSLVVEYTDGSVESNNTEEALIGGNFDEIGTDVGKLWLDEYDNIYGVTVRVYSNDLSVNYDIPISLSDLNFFKTRDVTTLEGKYSWTYNKEYNTFSLRALTEDIVGKQFEILVVFSKNKNETEDLKFNSLIRFQNNFWFYGNDNIIRWSDNNDPTYIPENNHKLLGDSEDAVNDMLVVSHDTALAFKKDNIYVINPVVVGDYSTYSFVEAKSQIGSSSPNSAIISPLKELPMFVNTTGIYGLQQLQNVQSTDRLAVLYSERINPKFLLEENISTIKTARHLYWTLFLIAKEKSTGIYVLDDRNNEWFYWELPIRATSIWERNDSVYLCDATGGVYVFKTTDIINKRNGDSEYYDSGHKTIKWYWKSQILPLGTINYSKKLLETTFVLSDTDSLDEYGINYTFKAYRKLASETSPTTISDSLNYVQSVTKRTMVHRFKFLQIDISNIEDDKNNNKFRLIGLGLKYTLLEGLR